MLRFEASSFALAGLLISAVPILIHLLYRRSFRTVHWAAMDFLKQALANERRRLRIRDLLLLTCRILIVLLIGFTFARPSLRFAGTGDGEQGPRTPIHAVLLIDNSRSMAVETVNGSLLDRAKSSAAELIERLPAESRISVVPICGLEEDMIADAFRNKEDAREALNRVTVVDLHAHNQSAFDQAEVVCRQTSDPSVKRIILLTDLQANSWQASESGRTANWFAPGKFPSIDRWGLQVVNVTQESASNIWVTDFHLEDGLASNDIPCRFVAKVHAVVPDRLARQSSGNKPLRVQVRLLIDESVMTTQVVELASGQVREVELLYQFDLRIDPTKPGSVVAAVEIQPEMPEVDQFPRDNRQQIVVPVASSVPIVFIDQYGDQENLDQNRIGETYALRHLMSPRSDGDDANQRLIRFRHIRPEELTRMDLEATRLVVVAGIEKPGPAFVAALRQFVIQGGPLVILAGSDFDPVQWTNEAWLDGRGILPVPLDAELIGQVPDGSADRIEPFFVSFASLNADRFLIEGEDPLTLASLFESTPFFKAVRAKADKQFLAEQLRRDIAQIDDERQFLRDYEDRRGSSGESDSKLTSESDDRRYRQTAPSWWMWRSAQASDQSSLDATSLAKLNQPKVLATFEGNGEPYAVERRIGAGEVVLFTSGVTSNWNLLRSSPVMYLFHRTFCQLIERTFPRRNFTAGEGMKLSFKRDAGTPYLLKRPTGVSELLTADSGGSGQMQTSARRALIAGTYRLAVAPTGTRSIGSDTESAEEIPLAVNGVESESDLRTIASSELQTQLGSTAVQVLRADQSIDTFGGSLGFSFLWKSIAWSAMVCLLIEVLILAWPQLRIRLLERTVAEA